MTLDPPNMTSLNMTTLDVTFLHGNINSSIIVMQNEDKGNFFWNYFLEIF